MRICPRIYFNAYGLLKLRKICDIMLYIIYKESGMNYENQRAF